MHFCVIASGSILAAATRDSREKQPQTKTDPETQDIPIIMCTGFSEQIDDRRAEEMGISAFVMKPIVMRQIANTIREVLDKK